MGYTSEVYIGIVKEQQEDFNKLNKGLFNQIWEAEDVFIYYGSYLKWNDSFEEVININELINSNKGNFCVAIGEDYTIHSEKGEWYYYIELEVKANLINLK
jgi:hypothetical protein